MKPGLEFWHVDAFAEKPFQGNPAGVTLFQQEPENLALLQQMAGELNLPINVFVWPFGSESHFALFFTPHSAVPVSGHGVLSASYVLWETGLVSKNKPVVLKTRAGEVSANRTDWGIRTVLPSYPSKLLKNPQQKAQALGFKDWVAVSHADLGEVGIDTIIELSSPEDVRNYQPDPQAIVRETDHGLVLTAKSNSKESDYVLRYFPPKFGLTEDWVTGLANSSLIPYWAKKLRKNALIGHQVSRRPGFVRGELIGGELYQTGKAVTVLKGTWKGLQTKEKHF